MRLVAPKWWVLAAAVLTDASSAALALLASGEVIPSVVRNPLTEFVQPGVTVWWLVRGGPFRSAPSSQVEIALGALINAALWSLVLWVAMLVGRAVRCMFGASPP